MFLENAFVTFISNKSKGIKLMIFYNWKEWENTSVGFFCFILFLVNSLAIRLESPTDVLNLRVQKAVIGSLNSW